MQRHDDALRLIGHADAASQASGMRWPRAVAFRERVLASLGRELGARPCAARVAEGRAVDPEGVCSATLRMPQAR